MFALASSPASTLHSTQYKRCYQLVCFPEFPVPLNNPPLLFPTHKHCHYPNMHSILSQESPTSSAPFLAVTHLIISHLHFTRCLTVHPSSLHLPTSFPASLYLCPPLCPFSFAAVIITCRSSNIFDSVSLTDSKAAALHAAPNGYLINLSLQVQLGESDKLGKLRCSAF